MSKIPRLTPALASLPAEVFILCAFTQGAAVVVRDAQILPLSPGVRAREERRKRCPEKKKSLHSVAAETNVRTAQRGASSSPYRVAMLLASRLQARTPSAGGTWRKRQERRSARRNRSWMRGMKFLRRLPQIPHGLIAAPGQDHGPRHLLLKIEHFNLENALTMYPLRVSHSLHRLRKAVTGRGTLPRSAAGRLLSHTSTSSKSTSSSVTSAECWESGING